MKVKEACEIAEACGLETIGAAIWNVDHFAMSIFPYNKMNEELDELYEDAKNYNMDDSILELL